MNDPITHYQSGAASDSRSQSGTLNRSLSYTNPRPDEGKPPSAATVGRSASYQDVRKEKKTIPNEFELEWVKESDVEAFERALYYDPLKSPSVLSIGADSGTEQISALNDFAPVREKVSRKRKSKKKVKTDAGYPKGFSYTLLRYPLMAFIGLIMAIELTFYLWLRQIVNSWEWLVNWRGKSQTLRHNMQQATTYEEWCQTAEALDKQFKKDEWKEIDAYGYYDYALIHKIVRNLSKYRQSDKPSDALKQKDILYACLKNNFGGIENQKLYSNTFLGTKHLIEDYVEEVTKSITAFSQNSNLSLEERQLAFKLFSKNYGRTALCLSGGATFGYYHLGVVKALFDRRLLPSVITGTSAGGLIAALVCCRTDEELAQVLNPKLSSRITIAYESTWRWMLRYYRTGARFDSVDWFIKGSWFTRGSLTFLEAYERTGRILNISVIPHDPHSPPKLLNYLTAPHCVIATAIIASAAVPGILNPVVLMQKLPGTDELAPYSFGAKWKDGSLRTDIPTQALHTQFNVKYTIVSQVNPHVHLFYYSNQGSPGNPVLHRSGKGWRGGFLASSIEQFLKLDLSKWLKVIRDLELMPRLLNQDWSSVFLQQFGGSVTIIPKSRLSDWPRILTDPDETILAHMIKVGQAQTWPSISMISNRVRIEAAIQRAREHVRDQMRAVKTKRSKANGHLGKGAGFQLRAQHALSREFSDDGGGSSDEAAFLETGNQDARTEEEKELYKAERRQFLAKFSDRRDLMDGKDVMADSSEAERQQEIQKFYQEIDSSDEAEEDDDDVDSLESLDI
ncbi:hypothetical protein K450DRAFT_263506 [Umbelopsis ramanniana AG]|uniref:Patatin-like phospholipase domain-containing protein n=1 Tax=Umbelopsis ramanniana AG TaxID=1314678 RepID=A0AAD5HA09_UMBRA|nr:uncharacterized protein K450DRAFT_263506 [Umbelopsis ramanniana AG]KAI8575056.1 hypothetical protein K450DRAFT_263506 [Umbelopsis ramanniana AG]